MDINKYVCEVLARTGRSRFNSPFKVIYTGIIIGSPENKITH